MRKLANNDMKLNFGWNTRWKIYCYDTRRAALQFGTMLCVYKYTHARENKGYDYGKMLSAFPNFSFSQI